MSVPAKCQKCGYVFISRNYSIGDAFSSELVGCSEQCPQPGCGGTAVVQSGAYDFIGNVMTAFTAPGMTREKVKAAKQVITEASTGAIASDEALRRLGEINDQLARLVEKSEVGRIDWTLILTIILAIYTIWTDHKSDVDAQAALTESRTQTEVVQKVLEESQAQSASLRDLAARPVLQMQDPTQISTPKNRYERRKSEAIERQAKRRRE